MGEVRGGGERIPGLFHPEHGVQQEVQSYESDIMTCAKSLTDCATAAPRRSQSFNGTRVYSNQVR